MNLKQTRIKSGNGGSWNVVAHVLKTDENEAIERLEGDLEEVAATAEARADFFGKQFALRHVVFSPDENLTPEQERRLFQLWKEEFDAENSVSAVMKHVKERADGNKSAHYHMILPELSENGKVLDSKFFKVRNEKIARLAEFEFGHSITKGRHNKAVLQALEKEAPEAAKKIEKLADGKPALSRFSSKAHKIAKRNGIDLSAVAQELPNMEDMDTRIAAKLFFDLSQKYNFDVRQGEKDLSIFAKNGEFISSLNRIAKIDKKENAEILLWMEEYAENFRKMGAYNNREATADDENRKKKPSGEAKNGKENEHTEASTIRESSSEDRRKPDRSTSTEADGNRRRTEEQRLPAHRSPGAGEADRKRQEPTDSRRAADRSAGSNFENRRTTSESRSQSARFAGDLSAGIAAIKNGKLQKAAASNAGFRSAINDIPKADSSADYIDVTQMSAESFFKAWSASQRKNLRM